MDITTLLQISVPGMLSLAGSFFGVRAAHRYTQRREKESEDARQLRDFQYLAVITASTLDRFAAACLDVVYDDGTEHGEPSGKGGLYQPVVATPGFDPLALNVEWKSAPADLLYSVFALPNRIRELDDVIRSVWDHDHPPDFQDMFWTRRIGYGELGILALDLAAKLLAGAGIERPVPDGVSTTRQILFQRVDQVRRVQAAHVAKYAALDQEAERAAAKVSEG